MRKILELVYNRCQNCNGTQPDVFPKNTNHVKIFNAMSNAQVYLWKQIRMQFPW